MKHLATFAPAFEEKHTRMKIWAQQGQIETS
jgi:hypothetical protein